MLMLYNLITIKIFKNCFCCCSGVGTNSTSTWAHEIFPFIPKLLYLRIIPKIIKFLFCGFIQFYFRTTSKKDFSTFSPRLWLFFSYVCRWWGKHVKSCCRCMTHVISSCGAGAVSQCHSWMEGRYQPDVQLGYPPLKLVWDPTACFI